MNAEKLRNKFKDEFLTYRDENWSEWQNEYTSFITEVESADFKTFSQPEFQQRLWNENAVTTIGPGTAVTVEGAYTDKVIVKELWRVKTAPKLNPGILEDQFQRILKRTRERHSKSGKNPTARLLRVFAAIRPKRILCIVSRPWLKYLKSELGLTNLGVRLMPQHLELHEYLREALNIPASLEGAVDVNQFAWWLAVQRQQKEDGSAGGSSISTEVTKEVDTDTPSLTILPVTAQRKGLFYVADNIDLLRTVVETASDGAARDELRDLILEGRSNLNSKSADMIINQAKTLGLLRIENNTYFLTKLGEDLRDGEPVDEVFVPTLVRRVFGFAHLMAIVRDANWAIEKNTLYDKMREVYPAWTTTFAPSSLASWGVQLGLLEHKKDKNGQLNTLATDTCQFWASGLPQDMSPWVVEAAAEAEIEDADDAVSTFGKGSLEPPSFSHIADHFRHENLLLPVRFLNRIHAALHAVETKKFVLLTGLSGTGKTSVARAYASSYCRAMNLNAREHYCEIAVWPDWSDPTGLIGFVNPLHGDPTFQRTEALGFLLKANDNPEKPYFLCLDEMNLARVEHYFAPFLSAMEGHPGKQVLKLHAYEDLIDNIPPAIPWPRNLYIFGTVNMDETTHPFSDKVLDRAFPFQLWDVDKDGWREAKVRDPENTPEVLEQVYPVLSELYDALYPIRRHFGYRVFDEVLSFCTLWTQASVFAETPMVEGIDAAVYSKVLPKIRGEDTEVFSNALANVEKVCTDHNLAQSAEKIAVMRGDLAALGLVRFWS